MSKGFSVTGLAHVGIRVRDLGRARAFYELLGFEFVVGPLGPEPVVVFQHPGGVELNLVLNAPETDTPHVRTDVPVKKPGITHIALSCSDVRAAQTRLEAAGYPLTKGPVEFPGGMKAIFVRDPDGTTIELDELPPPDELA